MARLCAVLLLLAVPALGGKAKEPSAQQVCEHLVDVGVRAYAVAKDEAMALACVAELELAWPKAELGKELRCALATTEWPLFARCGPTLNKAAESGWPFRPRVAAVCRHMMEVVDRETGIALGDEDRRKRNETCKQDLRNRWAWLPPAEAASKAVCVESATTVLAADACF
jgi:hypothetical protein